MRNKQRIKQLFAYILIITLFFSVTGCIPEENGLPAHDDTVDLSEYIDLYPEEKEAVILSSALMTTDLNPLKPSGENDVAFYQLLYKNIVDLDENQQCIPSVALEWNIQEDLKTWRFVIADNIEFSDGSLLTPNDVLFTLETLKGYGTNSPYYSAVNNIKSMEVDGNTLVINLHSEDITLPWKMNIPVLSKKAYESLDQEIQLTGTGPFKVESIDETGVTLKKINREKLFYKMQFVSTEKDAMEILKPGNNSISVVSAREGDLYEQRVDLYKNTYTGSEFVFIAFNGNAQYMNKQNIRNAISCFLNVEDMVNQVYGETMVRAEYPVHPDSFLLEWAIGAIHKFDPENGKALMKQENVPLYSDVYQKVITVTTTDAEGNTTVSYRYTPLRLRILVNAYDPQKMEIAQRLQSELEGVGIQTVINAQSSVKVKELISRKEYDILVSSVSLSVVPDPFEMGMLYQPGDDKMLNVCNLPSKNDLTALGEKTYKASSLSGMMEGLNDVQMFVKNNVPYIGLGYKKVSCVYSRTITGSFGRDTFSFFRDPENLDCR